MIIVIEGTDGSGKQTQTLKLYDYLLKNGKDVKSLSFPNYASESSILVKKYLNGEFGGINSLTPKQVSTLYAVDRLCTMQEYKRFLDDNGILLLDRYVTSNILHQATKINDENERNEMINWLEQFEYDSLELPKPDIIFFLEMRPDLSLKLRNARKDLKAGTKKDIHEQNEEYMKQCYNLGVKIASEKNWEIIKCYNNDEIKSIDEIHKEIVKTLIEKYNI